MCGFFYGDRTAGTSVPLVPILVVLIYSKRAHDHAPLQLFPDRQDVAFVIR